MRTPLLQRLRRRRQAVARAVLPLATLSWVFCGAPCLAGASGHRSAPEHSPSAHAAHGAAASHAAAADHSAHETPTQPAEPSHCPRCTANGGGDAAIDRDCAGVAAPAKPSSFGLGVAPLVVRGPPSWVPPPRAPLRNTHPPPDLLPALATHLRHRVLLI
jgi:hypothetical protein